jgi:hypothetical protein
MAQITLYVDDATQARLREAAEQRKVSQSQFVAELIRKATAEQWPEEVLELFGSMPDFPSVEELRAGQGEDAPRPKW